MLIQICGSCHTWKRRRWQELINVANLLPPVATIIHNIKINKHFVEASEKQIIDIKQWRFEHNTVKIHSEV